MKTVGQILKEARTSKGYTLEQVERETKIRSKFLAAIELDDYSKLPSQAYAKGFVKNYSDYLELNSDNILAFFRRQTQEMPKSSLLPQKIPEPLNKSWFRLTPGRFLALLLVGLATLFLIYLGSQYQKLQSPPTLVIEEPKDKWVTHEARLSVLGKTDADATVTVNNISVLVRSDGKFFDQITLDPGINHLVVTSISRYGKSKTVSLEVAYQLQ